MTVIGRVHNGVVVFEGPLTLAEGAVVIVSERTTAVTHSAKCRKPVELPIFPSDQPGSIELTNERIAEILDQEDATS
jgi:hypothetical protein